MWHNQSWIYYHGGHLSKAATFLLSYVRQLSGNVKFLADFDFKFVVGFNLSMCNDFLEMSNLWSFLKYDPMSSIAVLYYSWGHLSKTATFWFKYGSYWLSDDSSTILLMGVIFQKRSHFYLSIYDNYLEMINF